MLDALEHLVGLPSDLPHVAARDCRSWNVTEGLADDSDAGTLRIQRRGEGAAEVPQVQPGLAQPTLPDLADGVQPLHAALDQWPLGSRCDQGNHVIEEGAAEFHRARKRDDLRVDLHGPQPKVDVPLDLDALDLSGPQSAEGDEAKDREVSRLAPDAPARGGAITLDPSEHLVEFIRLEEDDWRAGDTQGGSHVGQHPIHGVVVVPESTPLVRELQDAEVIPPHRRGGQVFGEAAANHRADVLESNLLDGEIPGEVSEDAPGRRFVSSANSALCESRLAGFVRDGCECVTQALRLDGFGREARPQVVEIFHPTSLGPLGHIAQVEATNKVRTCAVSNRAIGDDGAVRGRRRRAIASVWSGKREMVEVKGLHSSKSQSESLMSRCGSEEVAQ